MLVLVLVTLLMTIVLVTPLAARSGTHALIQHERGRQLQHRRAVDSLVALFPTLLEADRTIRYGLDRTNAAVVSLRIGDLSLTAEIQDDSAKLPLPLIAELQGPTLALDSMLRQIGNQAQLVRHPAEEIRAHLKSGCFDDLFERATDSDLFYGPGAISRHATVLPGKINFQRAGLPALEAVFSGLDPGIAQAIVAQRSRCETVAALREQLELTGEADQRFAEALSNETSRYSLLIKTSHGETERNSFLVCTANTPPVVLARWELAR